jgi:hypothetical protein
VASRQAEALRSASRCGGRAAPSSGSRPAASRGRRPEGPAPDARRAAGRRARRRRAWRRRPRRSTAPRGGTSRRACARRPRGRSRGSARNLRSRADAPRPRPCARPESVGRSPAASGELPLVMATQEPVDAPRKPPPRERKPLTSSSKVRKPVTCAGVGSRPRRDHLGRRTCTEHRVRRGRRASLRRRPHRRPT